MIATCPNNICPHMKAGLHPETMKNPALFIIRSDVGLN